MNRVQYTAIFIYFISLTSNVFAQQSKTSISGTVIDKTSQQPLAWIRKINLFMEEQMKVLFDSQAKQLELLKNIEQEIKKSN